MEIAMVGLGKMGTNMSKRLLQGGHRVIVSDLNPDAVKEAEAAGAIAATSLADLVAKFESSPRAIWVMVPSGKPTESVVNALSDLMDEGDILIDGGNSNYKDTIARSEALRTKGIEMVDVGTSGGIWGLAEGYSMMIGGTDAAAAHVTPALKTLAPAADRGWGHVGPNGSGHYVKMVHNGIEYGMMQAYAEGFDLFAHKTEFGLDLHQIAEIWRYGSVVRSWYVPDSGEGRWTVIDSIEQNVPAPVITLALQMRFASRDEDKYWAKMLSAMRNQFGGHAVKKAGE